MVVANLQKLQPEKINSFEMVYRSIFLNNKLALDWDFYYNIYEGFLWQVEVSVPKNVSVGTDQTVLAMLDRSQQDRYRVYTNSNKAYKSYGSSMGILYNIVKNYNVNANFSYNNLMSSNAADIFITGFNTPK